jgi:hypothetical protein
MRRMIRSSSLGTTWLIRTTFNKGIEKDLDVLIEDVQAYWIVWKCSTYTYHEDRRANNQPARQRSPRLWGYPDYVTRHHVTLPEFRLHARGSTSISGF